MTTNQIKQIATLLKDLEALSNFLEYLEKQRALTNPISSLFFTLANKQQIEIKNSIDPETSIEILQLLISSRNKRKQALEAKLEEIYSQASKESSNSINSSLD